MASNLFKGMYLLYLDVCLFFLALNHLKQHRFNVLIAVKCLKTFYDHLILHQSVIRNRKLGKLLRILNHVISVSHHGQGLGPCQICVQ